MNLLSSVPFMAEEQIENFFSEYCDLDAIDDQLSYLCDRGYLVRFTLDVVPYDSVYTKHTYTNMWWHYSQRQRENIVDCLWVIAYAGEKIVREIKSNAVSPTPMIFVHDKNNRVYDLTPCRTREDAYTGYIWRDLHGDDDLTVHIAICYSEERAMRMLPELRKYEYDFYALIDPDTCVVEYVKIEDTENKDGKEEANNNDFDFDWTAEDFK